MTTLASKNVYSVSQLTQAIRETLESPFRNVSVQGEVTNLKLQASGHVYFTLKDREAQISAVLFRGNAGKLQRLPKDGDQIIALGEISVYPPRGSYQLVVRELQHAGLGELLLKFHKLKEELAQKGYFDPKHKKPLPPLPKKIGVVTSPTGAVIQDILHVLQRRFAGFHLILHPVKVQGEGAAAEIAQAIHDMNRFDLVDVMIVGRGGGSIEDLWAFNEEIVVKAIFDSKIPVISAVGHETDYTLSDLAADVRAPTPSAAAEMVLKEKAQLLQFLQDRKNRLTEQMAQNLRVRKQRLKDICKQPVLYSPYALLGQKMQRLDALEQQLKALQPLKQIEQLLGKLKTYKTGLDAAWMAGHKLRLQKLQASVLQKRLLDTVTTKIQRSKEKLLSVSEHLSSLDPRNILKKGYSILFSEKDSSIILSAESLSQGDKFYALLSDGKVLAQTEKVEKR